MNIIDKKPRETPANYFYGVNVNDKEAVKEEYEKLRKRHKVITIVVIIAIAVFGVILFDFCRVNFMGSKPLFAVSKKVERGTLFQGIGYKVLYCSNGERYLGSVLYKACDEIDERTFTNVVYEKFVNYSIDNKTLDKDSLKELTINNLDYDEDNEEGGSDYLLDITFTCEDDGNKCLKTEKEYYDPNNIKLIIRINRYNEIYSVVPFKTSGANYDNLKKLYTDKAKEYMINNDLMDEDNTHSFSINLIENHGKYKFRGTTYADSYLAEINYNCNDHSNTCIKAIDDEDLEGDFSNLSFYMSVFIDEDDNVLLMGPKEYFEL